MWLGCWKESNEPLRSVRRADDLPTRAKSRMLMLERGRCHRGIVIGAPDLEQHENKKK